jgi:hypothetical protein
MKHKCPRTRQIPEVAIIVKTQGQDFKMHMKYKGPITYHLKFKKLQDQGHKVKNYDTIRKFLP